MIRKIISVGNKPYKIRSVKEKQTMHYPKHSSNMLKKFYTLKGLVIVFLLATLCFQTSCSPKYGCPAAEQVDMNKKSKKKSKAKSGLFPKNFKRSK